MHGIISRLEENGFASYYVGGCVRDGLLGIETHDIDITTAALPQQVLKLFPKATPTGDRFGTVTVSENGIKAEITTMRRESGYSDRRHPDRVEFTTDILEDLKRRDFTVNAIAYSPTRGTVDPFDGAGDISRKLLRTVGDPSVRFCEDPLRILRAWRFCAVLGFHMEEKTLAAAIKDRPLTASIPPETVRTEAARILASPSPETLLQAAGCSPPPTPMNALAVSAAALHLCGGDETAKRYGCSARTIEKLSSVISAEKEPVADLRDMQLLLFRFGEEIVTVAAQVDLYLTKSPVKAELLRRVLESGGVYHRKQLQIDAEALGKRFGSNTARILDTLTLAVINGTCPNEEKSLSELANDRFEQ